jgi:hypothetical protein
MNIPLLDLIELFESEDIWVYASQRKDITLEIVRKYIHKPLDWTELSMNIAFTFDDIQKNNDLPWDLRYISSNPNITARIVLDNPNIPWNWADLTRNGFGMIPKKEKDLQKKYLRIWLTKSRRNCAMRRNAFNVYDCVVHETKMIQKDISEGRTIKEEDYYRGLYSFVLAQIKK